MPPRQHGFASGKHGDHFNALRFDINHSLLKIFVTNSNGTRITQRNKSSPKERTKKESKMNLFKKSVLNLISLTKGTISSVALLLLASSSAHAYSPKVICGGAAGTAGLEVDYMATVRGGNEFDQIVLRNPQILRHFISKQAIYAGELNASHEFIVQNTLGMSGNINNRGVSVTRNSDSSYTLRIEYTNSSFQNVTLADFTFNDCETLRIE